MVYCKSVFVLYAILLVGTTTAWRINDVTNYFNTPRENRFNLDVLPEYDLERHTLTTNGTQETVLYRMPGGPKSPPQKGKLITLIQHGVLCDYHQCTTNQPLLAIAYLLVDQGYEVWLGQSNSSIAENVISDNEDNDLFRSEELEKKSLSPIAQYVLAETDQEELSVMSNLNGEIRIFGITVKHDEPKQSTVSRWLSYIPGVKTAKKLYNVGRSYLSNGYDKVIDSFDYLGRKVDYVIDDLSIREFKARVLNTWGSVSTMVGPTLNIDDFSNTIDHPDVHLSTPDLIVKYGYQSEVHKIRTEDGYILTAHRISGGPIHPARPDKPVVILQHGILSSSADWIIMGPSKSLGYLLSDEGYDVWMGNSRGNTYSKAHMNLSTSNSEFWDFTWHEMGVYDIPALIDYVLDVTAQRNVSYIGHSQGVTQLLVTLSEKEEYNSKISYAVFFAPMAYAGNMRSPLLTPFARVSTPLYYLMRLVGVNCFLPTNAFLTEIGRDVCESKSVLQIVCSNSLFLATGYDDSQINKTMVPLILGHTPAGASTKQFVHFAQLYNSKKFRQYDHTMSYMNVRKYNQSEPPEYNLQNVRLPVAIFYGKNDLLAVPKDVEQLANKLPNVLSQQEVDLDKFNHIDFMYGVDAPRLVYHQVIESLRQRRTSEA